MDTALLICAAVIIILLIIILIKLFSFSSKDNGNADSQKLLREEISSNIQNNVKSLGDIISSNQRITGDLQSERLSELSIGISRRIDDMDKRLADKQEASGNAVSERLKVLENRFMTLEASNERRLEAMRDTMAKSLADIQNENSRRLDAIQNTVSEKLETKMNDSFKLVSERLEQVYKGLGEMQSIASGVGDLKKVLSNVKNRGILGEIQLGAILEDILAPEQFDRETPVIPGSTNRVEFAVKLPGSDSSGFVYLPVDSKFPGDTYAALQDAYDSGDRNAVDEAKKNLFNAVKKAAKDIHDKYIQPPYTTSFGIMFLPFEGLYAEIAGSGLIETLQRDFSVNVAGPSTMASLLSSLRMGFRTLAIQKKSSQVWEVLGAVKAEFETFAKALDEAQKHIKKVDDDLEKLVGVRTRQINRRLSSVEILDTENNSDFS